MKSASKTGWHTRCKKPANVTSYFDKIQVWFSKPLDPIFLRKLRRNCGKGGLYSEYGPARFNYELQQRVEFRQPNSWLINWLATRSDTLINRAEVALDLIFDNFADRDDAFEYFHRHAVRRWHGRNQEIRIYRSSGNSYERVDIEKGESRYDAGRWSPNRITTYVEECSRATGELFCLHHEWRVNGAKAVRSIGITLANDLVNFDFRQFWNHRLLLVDVDPSKIGALLRKRGKGNKNRKLDARTGHIVLSSVATMQELFDGFGSCLRLNRMVCRIDHRDLLPTHDHTL